MMLLKLSAQNEQLLQPSLHWPKHKVIDEQLTPSGKHLWDYAGATKRHKMLVIWTTSALY